MHACQHACLLHGLRALLLLTCTYSHVSCMDGQAYKHLNRYKYTHTHIHTHMCRIHHVPLLFPLLPRPPASPERREKPSLRADKLAQNRAVSKKPPNSAAGTATKVNVTKVDATDYAVPSVKGASMDSMSSKKVKAAATGSAHATVATAGTHTERVPPGRSSQNGVSDKGRDLSNGRNLAQGKGAKFKCMLVCGPGMVTINGQSVLGARRCLLTVDSVFYRVRKGFAHGHVHSALWSQLSFAVNAIVTTVICLECYRHNCHLP